MRLMKANVFTSPELVEAAYKNIEDKKDLNAFVNVRSMELAMKESEQSQHRIEKNEAKSKIDGIPIAIKDNILVEGMQSSAASTILRGF